MIYLLTATTTGSPDEVKALLDDHFAYLDRHHATGSFLVSGPFDPPTGVNVIVAQAANRTVIDRIMSEDPLINKGVVTVSVTAIDPGRVHTSLAGVLGVNEEQVRG